MRPGVKISRGWMRAPVLFQFDLGFWPGLAERQMSLDKALLAGWRFRKGLTPRAVRFMWTLW